MTSTTIPDIEEEFFTSGCHVHDAFKRYFLIDEVYGGHLQIHLHSNGLCYLTLAPTHPIIKEKHVIKCVEYMPQRLTNQVSGKRKRGSQSLQPTSFLCTVHTNAAESFKIRASVEGKLAELNKRLTNYPEEILSPLRGYLAIFMTKWVDVATVPKTWISEQDFLNGNSSAVEDSKLEPIVEKDGESKNLASTDSGEQLETN